MNFKGSKPIAQSWLGYFVSVVAVLMFVCLGIGGYFVYDKQYTYGGILFLVAVIMFAFLWYCDVHFGWVQNGEFKIFNKDFIYTYTEVVDMLGNNKFKYTIKEVSSVKRKGRNVIIKGRVLVKYPLRKTKERKKCVIYDITDEAYKYMEDKFSELKLYTSK